MSFHVTALVMRTKFGNSQRKCIALKLADCANDDGSRIFPSIDTVAAHSEVSKSTAQRVISGLVDVGVLVCIRKGGRGPRDTSEYAYNLDLLEQISMGILEFKPSREGAERQKWILEPSFEGEV